MDRGYMAGFLFTGFDIANLDQTYAFHCGLDSAFFYALLYLYCIDSNRAVTEELTILMFSPRSVGRLDKQG